MRPLIIICVALSFITLAVYWQTGHHEFINLDDDVYVTDNVHVKNGISSQNIIWAFTSIDNQAGFWQPITWLSHMADVQFYGLNPRGHHLTNVFIHTISALLLLLLFYRITGSLWQSAFVAAIFALHPLRVESVAWVAERKDVLAAFFWIFALLLYAKYVLERKASFYVLTLIVFILGLMAKPMVVTLPVVMLLMDFWPLNRYQVEEQEQGNKQFFNKMLFLLKEKIPFFACSLLLGLITIYTQHAHGATRANILNPLMLRVENSMVAYAKYIIQTFWPHELAVYYPFPGSIPLWQVICSLLFLSFISFAAWKNWRKHPYLLMGWLWFLVTLVPVIGLHQSGNQAMADRFTYIPGIGLFVAVTWGISDLARGLRHKQVALSLLAGGVIIAAVVLTWQQLGYWRDNISLYQQALRVTSGSDVVHNNLGIALAEKGRLDDAIEQYRKALALNPNHPLAHYNLGNCLLSKNAIDEAIECYNRTVKIEPKHFSAYNNLGVAYARKNRLDESINCYEKALAINPDLFVTHKNLGDILIRKSRIAEAIEEYKISLRINPNYVDAYKSLLVAQDLNRNILTEK